MSGDVDRDGVGRTDPRRVGNTGAPSVNVDELPFGSIRHRTMGAESTSSAIGNLAVSRQYFAVVAGICEPLMKAGINLCDQMMRVDRIKDNDEDDVDDTDKEGGDGRHARPRERRRVA